MEATHGLSPGWSCSLVSHSIPMTAQRGGGILGLGLQKRKPRDLPQVTNWGNGRASSAELRPPHRAPPSTHTGQGHPREPVPEPADHLVLEGAAGFLTFALCFSMLQGWTPAPPPPVTHCWEPLFLL